MSFRARLTMFFLLIVVVPMAAMAFLVFRLIDTSQQSKAQSRANGSASTAASVYVQASRAASLDARTLARALERTPRGALQARVAELAKQMGVARVTITSGSSTTLDIGDPTAVAPGVAIVRQSRTGRTHSVMLSSLTAAQFAAQIAGPGLEVVVNQRGRTLGSTLPSANGHPMPRSGRVTIAGTSYAVSTDHLSGFGRGWVEVTVLSNVSTSGGSTGTDRLLAALFIAAFLALAFSFALLVSKALQAQLGRFLQAARRLGSGDFSSPIETHGNDEFAALGAEFNSMSMQLKNRMDELEREQGRVRRSVRHIGQAFAANLDRDGLLELALETAVDATEADRGRVTARRQAGDPLTEAGHVGRLEGLGEAIHDSERGALTGDGIGEAQTNELSIATVALGPIVASGPTHGLITVCRAGQGGFNEDDLELLRSLAARATLALRNVNLHLDVQRQAVTDDLTELATHGHFQQLLSAEMDEVRRYRYPVGLVMLDLDDFKSINDLYGHRQGDIVLRYVAAVLRDNSRDVDVAARYGGEELSLILPHTDLDGTYAIAERVREEIERLEIPIIERDNKLRITASLGVASSARGSKDDLIEAADKALYAAKRGGKNRTVKASADATNVLGGR